LSISNCDGNAGLVSRQKRVLMLLNTCFGGNGHRCQQIWAASNGTTAPSKRGITRAVNSLSGREAGAAAL
jgi:hypothetical protein